MERLLEQLPIDAQVRAHLLIEMLGRERNTATAIDMAEAAASFIFGPRVEYKIAQIELGTSALDLGAFPVRQNIDIRVSKEASAAGAGDGARDQSDDLTPTEGEGRQADHHQVATATTEQPVAEAEAQSAFERSYIEPGSVSDQHPLGLPPLRMEERLSPSQQPVSHSETEAAMPPVGPARGRCGVPSSVIAQQDENADMDLSATERAIMRVARNRTDGFRAADIAAVTGQNKQIVATALATLFKKSRLQKLEIGLYAMPGITVTAQHDPDFDEVDEAPAAGRENAADVTPAADPIPLKSADSMADVIAWLATQDVEVKANGNGYQVDGKFSVSPENLIGIANRYRRRAKLDLFSLDAA